MFSSHGVYGETDYAVYCRSCSVREHSNQITNAKKLRASYLNNQSIKLEYGTDRLSRNVGKKLPLLAV